MEVEYEVEDVESGDAFCSLVSLTVEDQIFATVKQTEVYLLLEYSGAWGQKALKESKISEEVKSHLNETLERIPRSKLLLMKTPPGYREEGVTFHIIRASEVDPLDFSFLLEDYQDLLSLDTERILSSPEEYASHRRVEPFFTVCTNGRRDLCCAKWGSPFFQAMEDAVGSDVWRSTHVGGHRLAANSIAFPYGIVYGRMRPEHVQDYIQSIRNGEIFLDNYRGRSCYSKVEQAGEYLLRRETGERNVEAFRSQGFEPFEKDQWIVEFLSAKDGARHRLHLRREFDGGVYYPNCGDPATEPATNFHLEEYTVEQ